MGTTTSTYLNKFKQLFSAGDTLHTLADRKLFLVTFSFSSASGNTYDAIGSDGLSYYVRKVELPKISAKGDSENVIRNVGGSYRVAENTTWMADDNQFKMTLFDTESPLIDRLFLPWMQDAFSSNADRNQGSNLSDSRFPKATIRVDFKDSMVGKLTVLQYVITGAYPIFIDTADAVYGEGKVLPERDIMFAFNEIYPYFPNTISQIDSKKYSEYKSEKRQSATDTTIASTTSTDNIA